MIEFALTAPILLTLLLGLIEIGNGLNSYIKVVAVARDAARLGAQTCTGVTTTCNASLQALVITEAQPLRGTESSWITSPTNLCNTAGAGMCVEHLNNASTSNTNAVKVKVCYNHPLLIGLPGVVPNPMRMCSTSTMRVIN